MGIFSSEYEYYAFSQTQPIISDEDKRDTLTTFVLSALKHDDENLVGNIIAATKAGLPGTAYNYLQYGRSQYYWGLPESVFTAFKIDDDAILNYIGYDKVIEQVFIPIDMAFHEAIGYLRGRSWYNINEKQITLPITSSATGESGKAEPLSFGVRITEEHRNRAQIYFPIIWDTPDSSNEEYFSVIISSTKISGLGDALWVIYNFESQVGEPEPDGWDQNLVWPERGEARSQYPSYNFPEDPLYATVPDFYPISVFHRDYTNYYSKSNWAQTLRKLTKKLNIDTDEVYETFLDAINSSGASEAKLVDFSMGFLTLIYGNDTANGWKTAQAKYTFEFIKLLFNGQPRGYTRYAYDNYLDQLQEWEQWEDPNAPNIPDDSNDYTYIERKPRKPTPPQQAMQVSEADAQGFNYVFSFSLIERYTSSISHEWAENSFRPFYIDTSEGHYMEWYRGVEYSYTGSPTYVSYMVLNAEARYYVNTPDGNRSARPEGGIRCPVSYDILKNLSFRDQEKLLQDSLCAIVYTVLEQEIKWYQSSFWSGIIILITFILTVWVGFVGIQGVLSAIGLGTLGGTALFIALTVVKFTVGFLIQVTGGLLGFGETGQMVLGIITQLMMAGSGGIFLEGFDSLFSDLWLALDSFAVDGLSALTSNVGQLFQAGRMVVDVVTTVFPGDDEEDYTLDEQDKREEIEAAYLGTKSPRISDPHLELARRLDTNMFETPADYLSRTTRVNSGEQALAIPANYVDMALRLPRTIGTGVTVGVYV